MKWIKNRQEWLNEAKIRDLILKSQAKAVASTWGEKYLDYEEIEPTSKINQGKWKIEEEDRLDILSAFFDCDMKFITNLFQTLPDKFNTILNESINFDLLTKDAQQVLTELNIQSPTIDQIVFIFSAVFRKLDINQTRSSEMIKKDENGVPVKNERGVMIRVQKNAGDPLFSNNLVNINSFVDDYNRCYPDEKIEVDFRNRELNSLINLASDDQNRDYKFEFNIFGKELYLEIDHNPKDILNMSISKFYASCQHLYSGGIRHKLLGNVFDPNSIPAFLVFDSPIIYGDDKLSDKLPLSRMIIRNIEDFDESATPKIFFDRAYPDRMKDIFESIVEKYSNNKQNTSDRETYVFSPDIDFDDMLSEPYMDRLNVKRQKLIGINTKKLYLSHAHDWSKVKLLPGAKIKELVIETTDIPENLLKIDLSLEWVKFKNLKIKTLNGFENIKTDSISFDKCNFNSTLFDSMSLVNPNIKKLQLISCDIDSLKISSLAKLEELHLIFTIDSLEEVHEMLLKSNLKKLVISGDLARSKNLISQLKTSGVKIETVGPVI